MTDRPTIDEALCRLLDFDGPDQRECLYEALLAGSLVVAVAADAEGDESVDDGDGEAAAHDVGPQFALLEGEDGRVRIPAFTSVGRAGEFLRPGMSVARIPAVDLFELAVSNRVAAVVLNPGQDETLRLLPGELKALSQRKLPDVGQMGVLRNVESVESSNVANPPPGFVQHLARTLDGQPMVLRAYLFSMTPTGGDEGLFLGIELDDRADGKDWRTVMQQLGDRIISPPELGNVELIALEADLLTRVSRAHRPVFSRAERH